MKVPFVCLVWYAGVFVDVPSVVSRDAGQAQLNPSAALAGACSSRVLASLFSSATSADCTLVALRVDHATQQTGKLFAPKNKIWPFGLFCCGVRTTFSPPHSVVLLSVREIKQAPC